MVYGTAQRQLDTRGLNTHISVTYECVYMCRKELPSKDTEMGNHADSLLLSTDLDLDSYIFVYVHAQVRHTYTLYNVTHSL